MSLGLAALGGAAREYQTIKKEDRDWMKKYYTKTDDWLNGEGLASLQRNKKDSGAYKQMATRMIQSGLATPGSIMHILNHGKLDGLASVYSIVGKRDDITPEAFNDSINYAIAEDASDSDLNFNSAIDTFFGLYRGDPTNPVVDKENSTMASFFGIKSPFKREDRYDVDTLLNQPFSGSGKYTGRDIKRIASTDPTITASYDDQTTNAFTFNPRVFPVEYSPDQKLRNASAFRTGVKANVKRVYDNMGGGIPNKDDGGFSAYSAWSNDLSAAYKADDITDMYLAEGKREAWFAEFKPDVPYTNSFKSLVINEISNPGVISNNENAPELIAIYKAERAKYDAELLRQYNIAKESDPSISPFSQIGVFNSQAQLNKMYRGNTYSVEYAFINGKLVKGKR